MRVREGLGIHFPTLKSARFEIVLLPSCLRSSNSHSAACMRSTRSRARGVIMRNQPLVVERHQAYLRPNPASQLSESIAPAAVRHLT
jgi:hypothetical protein